MSEFVEDNGLWVPWGCLDDDVDLAEEVKAGGIDRNRGGAEKLRRYWTRGAGAAKIGWGTPGDFKRCVALLERHMPGRAEGYCANRHKEAVGSWPGRGHGHKKDDEPDPVYDDAHPDVLACADAEQAMYEEWAKTLDPTVLAETKALNIAQIFDLAGWIRNLAKDARGLLERVYADAGRRAQARLRDELENAEAAGLFSAVSSEDIPELFDIELPDVANAITNQVNRIADVDEATYARISDSLAEGEAKGESMPQLADRVRDVFETSKMRAMRIARTEVTAGANSAQHIAAQRNGAMTKTWISVNDHRTRLEHSEVDGETVAIDDQFSVGGVPMDYPGDPAAPPGLVVNCWPGWVRVVPVGRLLAVTRRWYDGPLVEIVTADADLLTVTPNHPVLTRRGWVAAQALHDGDEVLQALVGGRMADGGPEVDDVPPSVEEVHRAACEQWSTVRRGGSPMDFHGDGTDGDVEVVRPDGELADGAWETVHHDLFVVVGDREALLAGGGDRLAAALAARADGRRLRGATGGVGGGSEALAFFVGGAGHADVHRGAPVAGDDVVGAEPAGDGDAADAVVLADRDGAVPLVVQPTKVIDVRLREWAGHVYSVESETGVVVSDNVVSSNCRCTLKYGFGLRYDGAPESQAWWDAHPEVAG